MARCAGCGQLIDGGEVARKDDGDYHAKCAEIASVDVNTSHLPPSARQGKTMQEKPEVSAPLPPGRPLVPMPPSRPTLTFPIVLDETRVMTVPVDFNADDHEYVFGVLDLYVKRREKQKATQPKEGV